MLEVMSLQQGVCGGLGLFLGTAERVNCMYCSQELKVKGFEFYVNNE